MSGIHTLFLAAGVMVGVLAGITLLAQNYSLNGIKSKTVGDGQHGTARWATRAEIKRTYQQIPFTPQRWRALAEAGTPPELPQGIVVGCVGKGKKTTALVDTGDVHVLMIGAAGVGKTAYWLYPCLEYACAAGMSFLTTDTKGDLVRNYGAVARRYGYRISVSMGISFYPRHGKDYPTLFSHADAALYHLKKHRGKGGYAVYGE